MKISEKEELNEMGIELSTEEYLMFYLTDKFYPPIGENYKKRIIELIVPWMNGELLEDDQVDLLANGKVRWGDIVEDLRLDRIME